MPTPEFKNSNRSAGFSLLELLMVAAILALLGTAGFNFYYGFRQSVELEEEQNRIAALLRQAKGNAVALEQGYAWGVRFDNTSASNPFYALFAGADYASSNTTTKYFLPQTLEFEIPAAASAFDIIFAKRAGTTTAATTTIRLRSDNSQKKDAAVSADGLIKK